MKKIFSFLILIAIFILPSCHSKLIPRQPVNLQITDHNGNAVLLGRCTKEALQMQPYGTWFNKNYADYIIDSAIAEKLKPGLSGKQFTIFMGTWCGDSRREVPRMFKLLEYCGIPSSQVQLVMLNNQDSVYKQSPGHEEYGLDIHRVPDLLVYDHKKEIGRIVESPVASLEKDLLSIISNAGYVPNYPTVPYLVKLFHENTLAAINMHLAAWAKQVIPLPKNYAELNTYGYVLMAAKEMDKAAIVFKLNTLLFPENANVYDSYGEYFMRNGDRMMAKENYQKTLDIEPTNENAKKMLEQLKIK